MRAKIGCIVRKRIQTRCFNTTKKRPLKRPISRRKTGGVGLEFYHKSHHIDHRWCNALLAIGFRNRTP